MDHYRVVDTIGPEGVTLVLRRFVVVRETPGCYWIVPPSYVSFSGTVSDLARLRRAKIAKRVSKVSIRRYAYPTVAEAVRSYEVRKYRQIQHAELALERARTAHAQVARGGIAERLSERPSLVCEGGGFIKELNWSAY